MTTKHKVLYEGRAIGLAYVSPHPELKGHKIGSLIPITRKGKWTDSTLKLEFENPVHDIYPDGMADEKIAEDLTGQAAIEWWKVKLVPDSLV